MLEWDEYRHPLTRLLCSEGDGGGDGGDGGNGGDGGDGGDGGGGTDSTDGTDTTGDTADTGGLGDLGDFGDFGDLVDNPDFADLFGGLTPDEFDVLAETIAIDPTLDPLDILTVADLLPVDIPPEYTALAVAVAANLGPIAAQLGITEHDIVSSPQYADLLAKADAIMSREDLTPDQKEAVIAGEFQSFLEQIAAQHGEQPGEDIVNQLPRLLQGVFQRILIIPPPPGLTIPDCICPLLAQIARSIIESGAFIGAQLSVENEILRLTLGPIADSIVNDIAPDLDSIALESFPELIAQLKRIADHIDDPAAKDQAGKLAEAFVKGQLMANELHAKHLDAMFLSAEEWLTFVTRDVEPPEDKGEEQLAGTSSDLQDWAASGTGPKVPHDPIEHSSIISYDSGALLFTEAMAQKDPKAFLDKVFTGLMNMMKGVAGKAEEAANAAFSPLAKSLIDFVLEQVKSTGEVSPDRGFDVAGDFLTKAMTKGLEAHMLSIVLESVGFFKHFGFGQVSAFLAEMAAFGPIAAETWGRAIHSGIGRAAEYQVNSIARARIPSERDLGESFSKRVLGESEFRRALQFHGLNDTWIEDAVGSAWRPARLREVVMLAQDASIDQASVTKMLNYGGYSPEQVDLMSPIVMQQAIRGARGSFQSQVMQSYKLGLISDDEFDGLLSNLNLQQQALNFLSMTALMDFRAEVAEEHRKVIEDEVTNDVLDTESARLQLEALGYQEIKIDSILSRLLTKKHIAAFKEEQKQLEANIRKVQSTVLQRLKEQFQFGEIDAVTFFFMLQQAGFSEAFAREVVNLEVVKVRGSLGEDAKKEADRLKKEIVDARRDAFVQQFRKNLIDAPTLTRFLLQLNLYPKIVAAIVSAEEARKGQAVSAQA